MLRVGGDDTIDKEKKGKILGESTKRQTKGSTHNILDSILT
jgi:hypothetical protein